MSTDTSREGVIQSPPGGGAEAEETRVGRPPHRPTDEQRATVSKMAAYRIKHDIIAEIIGIDSDTLRKHYPFELKCGRAQVVVQVADSLVEKALSERPDAVNAAKFLLGSEEGWAERAEVSGPNGGAIEVKEVGGRDLARRVALMLATGMTDKDAGAASDEPAG